MKLTKCANGHFYDAEKYASCPHCSGGVGGADAKTDYYGSREGEVLNRAPRQSENDETQAIMGEPRSRKMNEEGKTVGFMERNKAQQYVKENMPTIPYADNEGKTIGYMGWAGNKAEKEERTEAVNTQPVVGWLVCIEGSNYGKSFNIYCGKNFIGRSAEMDICVAGDMTISRVKHATIIYEPKARIFFAQPGESHELFYVNDSVVLTNVQLKDRDVITIGQSVFVFVPFCDAKYGWEK